MDNCQCGSCQRRRAAVTTVVMPFVRDVTSQKPHVLDATTYDPLSRAIVEKRLAELEQQNTALQACNNALLARARKAEALLREQEARMYPTDTA